MKKLLVVALFLIIIQTGYAQTVTTFILVRHAEKSVEGGRDPELSSEGAHRAEALAALFAKTSVDAVYATDYKRTRNTVGPLAQARNLTVNTYASMKATDLERLLTQHAGGTIVMAGHSNTIPGIANTLVGEKKFEQFSEDDYGNILVISVTSVGKVAKVLWLRY